MIAAFGVMLAASLPAAFAQTATSLAPATGLNPGQALPGKMRVTEMIGADVHDAQNKKIGDVEEVVLDRDGRVAVMVLDVGSFLGIGGRKIGLGLNELKMTADPGGKPRFQVDLTKDQLKSAQAFDLNPQDAATTGNSTALAGANPVTTPPAHGAVTTTRLQPGQFRASELKGADIHDGQEKKIARINDMIVDRDGSVSQVVLEIDGKYVAIGIKDLKIATDNKNKPHISVAMTRDQLKSAQTVDRN